MIDYNDSNKLKGFSDSFATEFAAPQIRFWLQHIFKKPESMSREEQEYYDSMEKFAQELRRKFKEPFHGHPSFPNHEVVIHEEEVAILKGMLGDNYRYLTQRIEEKERLGTAFMDTSKEVDAKERMDLYFSQIIQKMADAKDKNFFKPYKITSTTKVKISEAINVSSLLKRDEDDTLEFKSSLRWNSFSSQVDRILEYEVMLTICAFVNTSGGRLIIGADDSGAVLGIEQDYKTFKNTNADGFRLKLVELTDTYLGKISHQFIDVKIENLEGKDICVITVEASDKPIYLKHDGVDEFFVRVSSVSQKLGIADVHSYISKHF